MRFYHFAGIAIGACLLIASGCGGDSAVAGPGMNSTDPDGADTASDGSVTPTDGGKKDTKTPPADGSGGGLCGDGLCEASFENAKSCPLDCDDSPGKIMGCVKKQCAGRYAECLKNEGCKAVMDCAGDCSEEGCVQECTKAAGGFNLQVQWVMFCATQNGCLDQSTGPKCGNGECETGENPFSCPKDCAVGPGPDCGNGECEPGESPENCIEDCGGGGGPIECASKACPKQFEQCASDEGCQALLNCMKSCDEDDCYSVCVSKAGNSALKVFGPLASCAEEHGCGSDGPKCGNNKCEQGENQYSCPQDCKPTPTPVCGNGKCEQGENLFSCPKDCADVKPKCGNGKCEQGEKKSCPEDCKEPPPPQWCGDGKCTLPENDKSCPKDCAKPADTISCVKEKCDKQFKTCAAVAACEELMDCAANCKAINCMISCWSQGSGQGKNLFMPVASCAQQNGCVGGESPQPVCGNGQCESGESTMSCPKDCGGKDDLLSCAKKSCSNQYADCLADKSCSQAVKCMNSCSSDACYEKCASQGGGKFFSQFANCAISAGCVPGGPDPGFVCGNGKCEPGETSQNCAKDCGGSSNNSCKGKCGQFEQNGGCQCDKQCSQYGDCCKDYKQYCGDSEPSPVCGDGKCQPPVETSENCPKDCSESKKPCKSKSDCSETQICCGQADGQFCVPIGKCG